MQGKASSSRRIDEQIWKTLWNIKAVPKVKAFLRKAVPNILPVMRNLTMNRVTPNPICSICGMEAETVDHCLLLCEWTNIVWFGSSLSYQVDRRSITTFDAWLLEVLNKTGGNKMKKSRIATKIAYVCWQIWKQRCAIVHGKEQMRINEVIRNDECLAEEWIMEVGVREEDKGERGNGPEKDLIVVNSKRSGKEKMGEKRIDQGRE